VSDPLTVDPATQKNLLPEGEVLRLNDWAVPGSWVLGGFALIAGLFLIGFPAPKSSNLAGPLRPVLGLVWLGMGLLIVGGGRSGLIVESDGIAVQGLVKRTRWTWSQVAGFELRQPFFKAALRVHLADGSEVNTLGFGAKSVREQELANAWVEELNRRASQACESS
jgi:hypothetical protein